MAVMIALDFTYSQEDCLRAWRLHLKERMNLPLDIAAISIAAAFGAWQWWAHGPTALSLTLLGLAGVMALVLTLSLHFVPRMAYRNQEKLKQPYHIGFSDAGIEFRTNNVSSQLSWEVYTKALVDRNSYLLYYGKGQFSIVPKHLFPDERSLAAFEDLIQMKIPDIVRR